MRFGVRNVYYLRISHSTVIPLYLYLDERHVDWMSERVLLHVLSDLRPKILQKLRDEVDAYLGPGGPSNAKKGTVDVHRGDDYQFGYFLRKMESHSVLVKIRDFVPAPPEPARPAEQTTPDQSPRKRRKRQKKSSSPTKTTKRRKTKGKQRAQEEEEEDDVMAISSDEDDEIMEVSASAVPPAPRRSGRAKKVIAGGYREDGDEDTTPILVDDDVEMAEEIAQTIEGLDDTGLIALDDAEDHSVQRVEIKNEEPEPTLDPDPSVPEQPPSPMPPPPDSVLQPDDTEEKKKLQLQLRYQGFNIEGRCLCVIVEPWPPMRAQTRAPSLAPMGLLAPRAPSIAPADFVASMNAARRERTPLFLPEDDDRRSVTPAPFVRQRTLPPVPLFSETIDSDSDDDENGGMFAFSQSLRSHQAVTAEDDDEMDGAVFFGDADETKEL